MADGRKNNKGSPEFQKNSGSWGWDNAAAKAANVKGNAAQTANIAKRKQITDKQQFLNDTLEAIFAKDPKTLEKILQNVADHAKGDDKAAMQAASIFMEYSGIKAPKQQEVKVEEVKQTMDEVERELKSLGVALVVDNEKKAG